MGDAVAVCDVDASHAEAAAKQFTQDGKVPDQYTDFRKLMERDDIHAIINGTPDIDGFTRVTVLEDTPDRLVVHARYLYRDFIQDGGGDDDGRSTGRCTGYGERTFTLTRDPETGRVAVAMSGEQEEPALRFLLRQMFGG